MLNTLKVFQSAFRNGFTRMTFEDASSIARLNRGVSDYTTDMSYGDAIRCRISKIKTGMAA